MVMNACLAANVKRGQTRQEFDLPLAGQTDEPFRRIKNFGNPQTELFARFDDVTLSDRLIDDFDGHR